MTVTVMSGAARALVLELEAVGVDPEPYLREAELSLADVLDPDQRLEAGRTEVLWRAAAEHVGDPLRVAERLPLGAFRVLDFLCAHSETIGASLRRLAEYFPLIDPRVRLLLELDTVGKGGAKEQRHALVMEAVDGSALPRVAQEFTLATVVLRSRAFSGVDWPLERVELACAPPLDDGGHRRVFRAPLRFGSARPRLVLSAETFALAIPTAESQLLPLLDENAKHKLASLELVSEPVAGVREAVRLACAEGRPTLEAVARRLALSPRTLQRRLLESQTTFQAVVDEERRTLSRGYLSEADLSIAEIAFLLGFSDQPAFTRAFTRWTGATPRAFRRAARR